jgi:inorganic triphosphatase YgiF
MDAEERELKLVPESDELLDRLERLPELGSLRVVRRRRERQDNAFFDTPTGALRRAGVALRRRAVEGDRLATWTAKGPAQSASGVVSRPEIEVQLAADTPLLLAAGLLRQAARERGAPLLAEGLADALASSPPLSAEPYLELRTDRRIADLEDAERGWRAELALDRVELVGHPEYADREVEVELKRGDEAALAAARAAIEQLGPVRESSGSKLSRALEYVSR